jgi:hypothetical protein
MTLPTFWRRAAFTVAESASLIGVSEDALRAWLARNVSNDFTGRKTGSRLYLSGVDAFYYLLVRHLAAFGVPVRTAMFTAERIAVSCDDAMPWSDFLLVRVDDQVTNFEHTNDPAFDGQPTLVLPLTRLMTDLIARAAVVYAADEGEPINKIGTAGGRPIGEWRDGIEAELSRMPVAA